jgi:hypothetical protein
MSQRPGDSRRYTILLLPVLFAGLLACGKRGDPQPPVPIIPRAVSDLAVAQRGPAVVLTWSFPSLTTSGATLSKVSRVVVYRYRELLPPSLAGGDPKTHAPAVVSSTTPVETALFAKVPPITQQQFVKLRERLDALESASIPAHTAGAKIVYEDLPPLHSEQGQPARYSYAVTTETPTEKSDLSNVVTIVPLDIAIAPPSLGANVKPEGIDLSWAAPAKSISGNDKPSIIGYNIYRSDAGATLVAGPTATPVNATPVREAKFTDVPPYGKHAYVVTAVAQQGPPAIESAPSPTVPVDYRDLLAPPPPANLATLSEEKTVRLVWDAVEASDLAGYKVYRTAGSERLLLTPKPIPETTFRDTTLVLGTSYIYSVSSIDRSGNESAAIQAPAVMLPK